MTIPLFRNEQESHTHSLETLNVLYEYDDFMQSIENMADMGCGSGQDLEWWATRTTREEIPRPLNIKCWGYDRLESCSIAKKHKNAVYQSQDFETRIMSVPKKKFDVIWCHDAFQYVIDPFTTLKQWRDAMAKEAMLVLILPQGPNLEFNTLAYDQPCFVYHNWTMVNLIHVLAVSGFDCASGFFYKHPQQPWLHAVVYNTSQPVRSPKETSWYQLAEANLLPISMVKSLHTYGHVRQRDLALPWLDGSLHSFANH